MKTFRILFSCGLLMSICVIGSLAESIQTDYDHSFNLAKLKTYSFQQQQRKPEDPLAASPLNDRRIHDALDSELKAHGLTDSTAGLTDFSIAYFVSTRAAFDIQDNRFGLLQRTGGLSVNQVTEGTLTVVFTDNATHQEVWRGIVAGEIDLKHMDKDVKKNVGKLVQKFVKNQAGKE